MVLIRHLVGKRAIHLDCLGLGSDNLIFRAMLSPFNFSLYFLPFITIIFLVGKWNLLYS